MKVSDFPIDYTSGLFTCCEEHISQCNDDATVGMEIECEHCGQTMKLINKNGDIAWRWAK